MAGKSKSDPATVVVPGPSRPATVRIVDGPEAYGVGSSLWPWGAPGDVGAPHCAETYFGWLLTNGPRKELRRWMGGVVTLTSAIAPIAGPAIVRATATMRLTGQECPKCRGDDLVGWPNLVRTGEAVFESVRCPSCGFGQFGDPIAV